MTSLAGATATIADATATIAAWAVTIAVLLLVAAVFWSFLRRRGTLDGLQSPADLPPGANVPAAGAVADDPAAEAASYDDPADGGPRGDGA